MNYVALKMLFGDRAKYLMLLCGLTFAVMLIVQQGSIFWGLMMWSQARTHCGTGGRTIGSGPLSQGLSELRGRLGCTTDSIVR